jgi:hypothetical protein
MKSEGRKNKSQIYWGFNQQQSEATADSLNINGTQ